MSRGYRIDIPQEVARGTVTGRDSLAIGLDVMPILPEDEMCALVRQELRERGWRAKDGSVEKELKGGAVASLSKDGRTVTVTLQRDKDVEGRGATKEGAQENLERAKGAVEQEAQRQATKELARLEPEVRSELDEALQRVYVEALKKKAAQMGQVESMQEQRGADGSLEITIKVRA